MPKPEFRIDCPKLGFKAFEAKSLLRGGRWLIHAAFSWEHSREGHDFWCDQYEAGELSQAGSKSLEEMVAMHEALGGAK